MSSLTPDIMNFDFANYSIEQKLALIGRIWDSIAEDGAVIPLTDAQQSELKRRIAAHEQSPQSGVSWDELKRQLREGE